MWVLVWTSHLNVSSSRFLSLRWWRPCPALLTGLSSGSNEMTQLNGPFQLAELLDSLLLTSSSGHLHWERHPDLSQEMRPQSWGQSCGCAGCWYGSIGCHLQAPFVPDMVPAFYMHNLLFITNAIEGRCLLKHNCFRNLRWEMFRKLKLEQGQKVLGGRMVFISDLLDGRVCVRSTSLCCSSGPRKLLCLSRPGRLLIS